MIDGGKAGPPGNVEAKGNNPMLPGVREDQYFAPKKNRRQAARQLLGPSLLLAIPTSTKPSRPHPCTSAVLLLRLTYRQRLHPCISKRSPFNTPISARPISRQRGQRQRQTRRAIERSRREHSSLRTV